MINSLLLVKRLAGVPDACGIIVIRCHYTSYFTAIRSVGTEKDSIFLFRAFFKHAWSAHVAVMEVVVTASKRHFYILCPHFIAIMVEINHSDRACLFINNEVTFLHVLLLERFFTIFADRSVNHSFRLLAFILVIYLCLGSCCQRDSHEWEHVESLPGTHTR